MLLRLTHPTRPTPTHLFAVLLILTLCTGRAAAQSMEAVITFTAIACQGGASTATVSVTGNAQPPFNYLWSNGLTAQNAVLPAGVYSVTVFDSQGQSASDIVSITEPAALGVAIVTEQQICAIAPDGSATAVPFGGTPPYAYTWSNNGSTAQITGLAAGTYAVTVTDANGCTSTGSGTVEFWDEGLWLMLTPTDVRCHGDSTGSIKVSPMSGTPPYTYIWSSGDTTATASNLPAGAYSVTVTDINGCQNSLTGEVLQPAPLVLALTAAGDFSCAGVACARAAYSGGTPPYTLVWSTGAAADTICGLTTGVYTAMLTDANFCTRTDSISIQKADTIAIEIQITGCAGCALPGSAAAAVSAGSGNYSYLWDNGETSAAADSLTAGPHTVTVTDLVSGCTDTASVFIPACAPVDVQIQIDSLAGCLVGGQASVAVSGGLPPYSIQWDNGQTGPTADSLSPGAHTVTVTDAAGCVFVGNFTMGQIPRPELSILVLAHAACNVGGSAQALVSGGLPPYSFLWDNGDTTAVADSLAPGIRCVTLTDANGCADTACVVINPPPNAPVVVITNITPGSCLATAVLQAGIASGGTPPYTFLWSNGDTGAVADSLAPGIYCVTVMDSQGCMNTACDTVLAPTLPNPVATLTAPAGCLTGATATVSVTGGVPPYTYLWTPGNYTTASVSNLPPGAYTITVTDANGCTGTASLTVSAPNAPVIAVVSTTKQNCSMFGTAIVSASGGTAPYLYEWENGELGPEADSLSAGSNIVIVTDAAGCRDTAIVSIFFTPNGINVGDWIWYDDNQNGFQDPQETEGVNNIIVRLTQAGPDGIFGTSDDVILQRDTTGPDGMYNFDCVLPGNYVLVFSGLPFGFQWAAKNQFNDDCLDSDVNANGRTDLVVIPNAQSDNLCLDAGVHLLCQNVINAGLICCNQTICAGDMPALLAQVTPPGGGQGSIEFAWRQLDLSDPAQPVWVDIPGASGANYQPPALTETAYFLRRARRAGCIQFLESNIVTITVLPAGSPGCGSFLADFTVAAMEDANVQAVWRTLPEPVQFTYTLEHAPDQIRWAPVETLLGKFNPLGENNYAAIHQTPVRGMNYYRIRRVDPFGLAAYSEIRTLEMNMAFPDAIRVYPNPVSEVLQIENMAALDSEAKVELIAPSGAVLRVQVIPKTARTMLEIPVGDLASGLYFVRITFGDGARRTVKISKF